jgi:hypothetical protein
MNIRTLALIGLLGLGAATSLYAPPASARTYVDVNIGYGRPPPPRYEHVIVRSGWVWAPGHWSWRHHHYVWVPGHWVRERRGYVWVGPRWEPYGPNWRYHDGYWQRR